MHRGVPLTGLPAYGILRCQLLEEGTCSTPVMSPP